MDSRHSAPVDPGRSFRAHRCIRRRATARIASGRLFWVVPTGLAAGWELVYHDRVFVVREIRSVEINGRRSELAIVEDSSRHRESVEIAREDNAGNSQLLEGSLVEETMP